jgi:hypothetical protein
MDSEFDNSCPTERTKIRVTAKVQDPLVNFFRGFYQVTTGGKSNNRFNLITDYCLRSNIRPGCKIFPSQTCVQCMRQGNYQTEYDIPYGHSLYLTAGTGLSRWT